jgi:Glutathione S-transferase, C-terminal domain
MSQSQLRFVTSESPIIARKLDGPSTGTALPTRRSIGRRASIWFWPKAAARKRPACPCSTAGLSSKEAAPSSIGQIDKRRIARQLTVADAREIERRADHVIGVHVRRLVYAELLPRYPELATPGLFGKASDSHRLSGNAMWHLSRRIMMRMHDITPDAAAESRSILESELDWLDSTLADDRRHLSGDRFSRADITVATLLAFFCATPRDADISGDVHPCGSPCRPRTLARSAGGALGCRPVSSTPRTEACRRLTRILLNAESAT